MIYLTSGLIIIFLAAQSSCQRLEENVTILRSLPDDVVVLKDGAYYGETPLRITFLERDRKALKGIAFEVPFDDPQRKIFYEFSILGADGVDDDSVFSIKLKNSEKLIGFRVKEESYENSNNEVILETFRQEDLAQGHR